MVGAPIEGGPPVVGRWANNDWNVIRISAVANSFIIGYSEFLQNSDIKTLVNRKTPGIVSTMPKKSPNNQII
jgi:hypothetical protein